MIEVFELGFNCKFHNFVLTFWFVKRKCKNSYQRVFNKPRSLLQKDNFEARCFHDNKEKYQIVFGSNGKPVASPSDSL